MTREHEAVAWIYEGVWTAVVRLFKVPSQPPTLPTTGESVRSIRPALEFLQYLKFLFWVALVPGDILPILGWVAVFVALPPLAVLLLPLFVILVVLPDVVVYVGIHLRYDTTWYVLTDRSLRIRRGIWVIHETTISFENVQNVEVRQGPVQRYFGIADVVVQTAGGGTGQKQGTHAASGNAHIALLQGLNDAQAVRDLILDRVRRLKSAGLGDEMIHGKPDAVPAHSTAHLPVLREIRDVTARLAGSP